LTRTTYCTFIDIFVTVLSFVVRGTFTGITTDSINTGSSVLARLVHSTLVHILITVLSSKSVVTSTLVVSVSVGALGSILARIGGTFVYIFVAVLSLEVGGTLTSVTITIWATRGSILALITRLANVVPLVSTVTEPTARCFGQLIHIECSTVTDINVNAPMTEATAPVEANLSLYHSIFLLRMFANHPARCVCPTVMLWNF